MDSLSSIPKVGPATTTKLNALGIYKPTDILFHFPTRYIDFSQVSKISSAEPLQTVTVTAKVVAFKNIFTRNHKNIQKATVTDDTGIIDLIWFNQPYLSRVVIVNQTISFAGTVSLYQNKKTIITPVIGEKNTGHIIAIYPETKGLGSSWFRSIISTHSSSFISTVIEQLPKEIISKYKLLDIATALHQIHLPTNNQLLNQATYRLGLDEILSLQASAYLNKLDWSKKTPRKIYKNSTKIDTLIKNLPFELTPSQLTAWQEIKTDLLSTTPCNRLLQGDVGSGKTIVALLACYLAHLNRSTSLIIAPTEILAQQHLVTFTKILKLPIKFLSAKSKITKVPLGSVIVSTHAAIYQNEAFQKNIGLVIIDEQHKFGVKQRTFLNNVFSPPHCLTMTATPIPRTVSLTVMGHLSLSTLTASPKNRQPIKTYVVPNSKYNDCYRWLDKHIQKTSEQAFVVCPFIEPSETMSSVKDSQTIFEQLRTTVFPNLKLALIHGKISQADRQRILDDFAKNKINILVSTPIIEVGIDFPNATTMIIQSADRFGLAQLHQLRGRVGRSKLQSYCYLFSESQSDVSANRLNILKSTNDGQKIAEYDLKTRGPGEAFSLIQHGFPSLKIASLNDYELINLGQRIIKDLSTKPFDIKKLIKGNYLNVSTN